jgi:hypothetical protein
VKLRSVIRNFSRSGVEVFVVRMMDIIFSSSSNYSTRYKLLQMLSAIHNFRVPEFESAFEQYQAVLQEIYD